MARLVPNPLHELHAPLQRIEGAVTKLGDDLSAIGSLPSILTELAQVNQTLVATLKELKGLRKDLAELRMGEPRKVKPAVASASTRRNARTPR